MFNPMQGGAPQQNQINPLQAIQDFARQIGSPQRLVQQFFGFVPQNIQNDPNQIINYLINSGKVSPQQIDTIRDYISRNGIK